MIGITGSYNCDNNFLEKIKDPFLNFNSKNFKNLNININYTDNDINGTFYKIDKSNFCLVLGDIFDDRVIENKISKSLLVSKLMEIFYLLFWIKTIFLLEKVITVSFPFFIILKKIN